MIVSRVTWVLKFGCEQQALALLKEELTRYRQTHDDLTTIRVYTPYIAPMDVLVFESEWETMEQHKNFWDGYNSSEEGMAFFQKFSQFLERGGHRELWYVDR